MQDVETTVGEDAPFSSAAAMTYQVCQLYLRFDFVTGFSWQR